MEAYLDETRDACYEFLDRSCDNNGLIKGTRTACPADAPVSKYLAIFDPRECFDKLRESFIVQADGCGLVFLQALQHAIDTAQLALALRGVADQMHRAVSALGGAQRSLTAPQWKNCL